MQATHQRTHKVPTHMSLPDKVVFGLTARQLLLLLIGCSLGYNLWLHLGVLEALALLGKVLRIVLALIPAAIAATLAMIYVADRPLEVWLLVLVRYWQRPRIYLWRSLRLSTQQQSTRERDHAPQPVEAVWSYA
jgi:PrgI family protein